MGVVLTLVFLLLQELAENMEKHKLTKKKQKRNLNHSLNVRDDEW